MVDQICGKMNHSALECWKRIDHTYQTSVNESFDPNIYTDSSATTHVINDPGKLKGLYVGNGEALNITHTSTHHISTDVNTLALTNVLVVSDLKRI